MKSFFGLSDSLAGVVDNPAKCPQCDTAAWVGSGQCLNCLLNTGLDRKRIDDGTESLDALLDAVNVPDQQWRLGNYEILEEIGRGGMGVIYRARQRHSRRIVAVKRVLSYHADSQETLERFRREAEAVASLDHPNILPIYEVSESEEGLPFFSMKFAPGGSLQEASHSLRGDPRQCVAIVAKVAHATAHAHGQGILHRDLKPGNILLDGRGEPLVSDFGLAKWLDTTSDLTRTLTTFGTPGYIAPEQAQGHSADLTAATDVYSLGAILFDLLTGRPPFIGEHALSVIRQASEIAAPKLRTLSQTCDRDLETICAKCLDREPRARYQSAIELAIDLECWLEGRPIRARRVLPSTRAWRWSRRNAMLVSTAAGCLFLGAASFWLFHQTGSISTASRVASGNIILSGEEKAEQTKLGQALARFLDADLEIRNAHLGYTNASQISTQERLYAALGRQTGLEAKWLREKLPKFAKAVKRDPAAPVSERAHAAYFEKDYAEGERLALQAAAEAQTAPGVKIGDQIDALNLAAWAAGRSTEFSRALEHLREAEKLTDEKNDLRRWANIQFSIGNLLLGLERISDAETTFRELISASSRGLGPEDPQTLRARRRRAYALLSLGKDREAQEEYRDLIKMDEKILGPEHPETLWSRWDLADALGESYAGELEASLTELRQLLSLREKVLGPEHPDTLRTRGAMANQLFDLGKQAEAIKELRGLLQLQEKVLGPEDNGTLLTAVNLAGDLANTGEYSEAEALLRHTLALREKTLGPTHHSTLFCRKVLIKTIVLQRRYAEAELETQALIRLNDTSVGVERSPSTYELLGRILDKQGRHIEAEVLFREAVRMNEKAAGPEEIDTVSSRASLARNLCYQGKSAEAEVMLRSIKAANEKILGSKIWTRFNNNSTRLSENITPLLARLLLANSLRNQRKYAEAEHEYKEVIGLGEKLLGPDNQDTLSACYNYAYQLAEQNKMSEARPLVERAATGAARILGINDSASREYAAFLLELEHGHPITVSQPKFRDNLPHLD